MAKTNNEERTIRDNEIWNLYLIHGCKQKDIAENFKLSYSIIKKIIKDLKIIMKNKKELNAEIRAKFIAGSSKEELIEEYGITGRQLNGIIWYQIKKSNPQIEVVESDYSTPYQLRDNEIIKVFSNRNTKGALSMSHIEVKALHNTRMKI